MAKTPKPRSRYKRAFITGLATLLPTILTIYILLFCFTFLQEKVASPIRAALVKVLATETAKTYYWKGLLRKQDWQVDETENNQAEGFGDVDDPPFSQLVQQHAPPWVGFVLAVVVVLTVGFVFKGYLGRQLVKAIERLILRIPIIKVIYPYAKQVTEFFFEEKKTLTYESAVCIEYPRKGVYSVGFVTNEGFTDVTDRSGEPMVSIFIPSSPTPVTGYTIQIPRSEVIRINITVDEALRYTISGGVILPPGQLPPLALKTKRVERPRVDPPPEA